MTRAADDFAFIAAELKKLEAERETARQTFRCDTCDGIGWIQDAPMAIWAPCPDCENIQGYPSP